MVYRFSPKSETVLKDVHPNLVRIVRRALAYGVLDFTVVCGYRSLADQQAAYDAGHSKISGRGKPGKHNVKPSRAVDLAPYPIDWTDAKRFGILMATMCIAAQEEFGKPWRQVIRLGGNWDGDNDFHDNNPEDPGHFELMDAA